MQAGAHERLPGLDGAGDPLGQGALCMQSDDRARRLVSILLLQWRLQRLELLSVHGENLSLGEDQRPRDTAFALPALGHPNRAIRLGDH